MFHVNQYWLWARVAAVTVDSLADTELGEDGAEHLLDVDLASQTAKMAGGQAKLLGLDFRPSPLLAEPRKRGGGGFELGAMAGAGDGRWLSYRKPLLGVLGENLNEFGHARAGFCRKCNSLGKMQGID
jgi:hypothetical protein